MPSYLKQFKTQTWKSFSSCFCTRWHFWESEYENPCIMNTDHTTPGGNYYSTAHCRMFFIINYFYLFQSSLFFVCVICFNKGNIYATLDEPPTPVSQNKWKISCIAYKDNFFSFLQKVIFLRSRKYNITVRAQQNIEALTLFYTPRG